MCTACFNCLKFGPLLEMNRISEFQTFQTKLGIWISGEYTVVADFINIMKTTFDFNFDLYQAFKQDVYCIHKNMETKRSCRLEQLLFYY